MVQNLVKKWLKSEPKNAQIKDNIYTKISLRPVVLVAVFEAMGPSKNANFEKKKNGPKMIQKWFKIAQIA